jgi:Domain of unknown function (DUF4124)
MNRRLFASLCCMTLCTATGAAAQTVYKQADAFGRVSFADQPAAAMEPGASEAEATTPSRKMRAPIASKRSAEINASEATRRLEQARLKRKQGVTPLPGEQVQGANGRVLNYRYWQRQEKLRLMAEQAQQRWRATNQTQIARQ